MTNSSNYVTHSASSLRRKSSQHDALVAANHWWIWPVPKAKPVPGGKIKVSQATHEDKARRIAANIAKLPELLRKE